MRLLQAHGQAVDPNLNLLAQSFELVTQKLQSADAGPDQAKGTGTESGELVRAGPAKVASQATALESRSAQQPVDGELPAIGELAGDGQLPAADGADSHHDGSDADVRLARHHAKKGRSLLAQPQQGRQKRSRRSAT